MFIIKSVKAFGNLGSKYRCLWHNTGHSGLEESWRMLTTKRYFRYYLLEIYFLAVKNADFHTGKRGFEFITWSVI